MQPKLILYHGFHLKRYSRKGWDSNIKPFKWKFWNPKVNNFYQHWKEVFKNQVTLILSKSFFLNVQHRFIVLMKKIRYTHREEREMDEPKLVACECSTDVEENRGNSLLPNLLVAILKAMAVNQRKKNGRVTSQ